MSNAFIFPGQGSQKIGMASAFVNGFKTGMEVMEEIEDAISFKLSKLIEEGSIEDLTKTENAQPALFAVSIMIVKILEKEYGYDIKKNCKYLAGHSLGEYTALCASGVFSISDTAKLVRFRGELMANAFPNREECSMMALIGVSADDIEDLIKKYQNGENLCVIANDNSNTQVVVSGTRIGVKAFVEEAKEQLKIIKAIELNTSGPFHSPLMAKASIAFDKKLSSDFSPSNFEVPVIMNVSAKPLSNKDEVKEYMIRQITSRVRWRESMQLLVDDPSVEKIIEIGSGKVLSNMLKRSFPEVNSFNLETVAQIEEFVKSE